MPLLSLFHFLCLVFLLFLCYCYYCLFVVYLYYAFFHFNTVILPFLEEYYLDNSFKCIAPLSPPASLLFFQLCSLVALHALSQGTLSFSIPSFSSASISPFYLHLLTIDLRFVHPD